MCVKNNKKFITQVRNKHFIAQIWNGGTLYLCLSIWHRKNVNRRTVFVVDILWFTGTARLIFIAIVPVKGDKNSKTLLNYTCQLENLEAESQTQNLWGRFIYFFFPQIGFKTKSQSTRDWKLSPLSSGAKKLSDFFFVCFMSVLSIWVYMFTCQQTTATTDIHGQISMDIVETPHVVGRKTEQVFLYPGFSRKFTFILNCT